MNNIIDLNKERYKRLFEKKLRNGEILPLIVSYREGKITGSIESNPNELTVQDKHKKTQKLICLLKKLEN